MHFVVHEHTPPYDPEGANAPDEVDAVEPEEIGGIDAELEDIADLEEEIETDVE